MVARPHSHGMTDDAPTGRRRLATALLLLLVGTAAVRSATDRDEPAGHDPPVAPEVASPSVLAGAGLRRTSSGLTQGGQAPAEPATPSTGAAPRIVGRVLDEAYRPAAGVSVTVDSSGFTRPAHLTDAEGRFSVKTDPRGSFALVGVLARTSTHLCATGSAPVHPGSESIDIGVLVLSAGTTLEVRATAEGRPLADAEVHLSTYLPYAPPPDVAVDGWPFLGWTHAGRTDSAGIARLEGVPLGDVRVLVRGKGPSVGEARVSVETDPALPVTVACEPARDIEVVIVEGDAETPLAGADISVYTQLGYAVFGPGAPLVTDRVGRAVIRYVPMDLERALKVCHESGWWFTDELEPIPSRVTAFRMHVRRSSVRDSEAGGPAASTPDPPFLRRRIAVRVLESGGAVAQGCEVRVYGVGLGRYGTTIYPDATGLATLTDLQPNTYQVRVETWPELADRWERADLIRGWDTSVDLARGDERAEIVVPAREEAIVLVRTDGRPGIPTGARFYIGLSPAGAMPTSLRIDPDRGEVRFPLRTATPRTTLPLRVSVQTPHHGSVGATLTRQGDGSVGAILHLSATGRLVLRARLAPGRDVARLEGIEIQRAGIAGAFAAWKEYPKEPTDDCADLVYLGVRPGRYRAFDRFTGRVSEPTDVIPGAAALLVFDVSRSQVVEGTIELPEGLAPESASVRVLGDGIDADAARAEPTVVAPDRFRVTIPGDRPVRLVPAAQGCLPDPTLPETVVESAMGGIRLRLVLATPR